MADEVPQATVRESPGSLSRWERAGATVLGLGFGGSGVAAVFITENGAGTAALLILAAAMLLIAVQGTPLTRFGSETASLEFANKQGQQEARREISSELAERSAANDDPAQAAVLAEAAQIALPSSADAYEARVAAALKRVLQDRHSPASIRRRTTGPDFEVQLATQQTIAVEAVFRDPYITARDLHEKTVRAIRKVPKEVPVLVIINAAGRGVLTAVTRSLQHLEELAPTKFAFVEWNDADNDKAIADALQQLGTGTAQ